MTIKEEVQKLLQDMQNLALRAATEQGALKMRTYHADGIWAVEVHPDGRTVYGGYAEESRGPYGTIEDLTMWELAALLERL